MITGNVEGCMTFECRMMKSFASSEQKFPWGEFLDKADLDKLEVHVSRYSQSD